MLSQLKQFSPTDWGNLSYSKFRLVYNHILKKIESASWLIPGQKVKVLYQGDFKWHPAKVESLDVSNWSVRIKYMGLTNDTISSVPLSFIRDDFGKESVEDFGIEESKVTSRESKDNISNKGVKLDHIGKSKDREIHNLASEAMDILMKDGPAQNNTQQIVTRKPDGMWRPINTINWKIATNKALLGASLEDILESIGMEIYAQSFFDNGIKNIEQLRNYNGGPVALKEWLFGLGFSENNVLRLIRVVYSSAANASGIAASVSLTASQCSQRVTSAAVAKLASVVSLLYAKTAMMHVNRVIGDTATLAIRVAAHVAMRAKLAAKKTKQLVNDVIREITLLNPVRFSNTIEDALDAMKLVEQREIQQHISNIVGYAANIAFVAHRDALKASKEAAGLTPSLLPTLEEPATGSIFASSGLHIIFHLPEPAKPTSLTIVIEREGGKADANSPHEINLGTLAENKGWHDIDLGDIATTVQDVSGNTSLQKNLQLVRSYTNTGRMAGGLVAGTVYSIQLSYRNTLGNAISSVKNTSVTCGQHRYVVVNDDGAKVREGISRLTKVSRVLSPGTVFVSAEEMQGYNNDGHLCVRVNDSKGGWVDYSTSNGIPIIERY